MKPVKLISAILLSSVILSLPSCSAKDKNTDETGTPTGITSAVTDVTDNTEDIPAENTLGLLEENLTDSLFNYGLVAVKVGDKWGFINEKGEMVIEPQLVRSDKFRQGVIAVNEDGKYRFMNTKGEWVAEPADGIASFFTEDYCVVRTLRYDDNGNAVAMQNKLIDSSGRVAIELPENVECWPVRDGMFFSRNETGIAIYSTDGEKLISLDGFRVFAGDESTYKVIFDGVFCAENDESGKWGIVDTNGNWIVEPKFDSIGYFEDGLAYAYEGELCGFINTKGEWVVEPKFKKDIYHFSEGLAAVEFDDGRAGYIDKDGNMVITLDGYEWVLAWEFDEGVASVLTDKGAGIIDKTGGWIVSPSYHSIGRFNCGIAPIEPEFGKHGFINSKGEIITGTDYRTTEYFYDDGYGVAMKPDGKWVIVDTEGNVVIDGGFDGIGHYYTYYDEDGSVMPCATGR